MATKEKKKFIDFAEIKATVSMEQVLDHLGLLEGLRQRGDQLVGVCPIHEGSNHGQFNVSTSKNVFHCFGCKKSGNLLDFVKAFEDCSVREAGERLCEWFNLQTSSKPKRQRDKDSEKRRDKASKEAEPKAEPEVKENIPLTFELKDLDTRQDYLRSRGLTAATIEEWGLGYCGNQRSSMFGRIVFPIHNPRGELIAYAGRWANGDDQIPEGEGKWKLPPKFYKRLELYGLHRILKGNKSLIVLESFWGVVWLWQCGYRNVVSCMGSSLSMEQLRLLSEWTKGTRVFFDGDSAGETGALEAGAKLYASGMWCRMVRCPQGRQPDQLSAEELKKILG